MRCRKFCIRNGVANGSNIYNVVSDEYFKQRIIALQTLDATRKLGQSAPDFVEEFVFDGTYPGLLADAVRRLFTESEVQNPASEVMSTNQNGKPQPSTLKQGGRQAYPIGRLEESSLSLPCLMLVNLMTHNRVRLLILMSWQMLVALKPLLTLLIHIVNLITIQKYQILTLLIHNLNLINI